MNGGAPIIENGISRTYYKNGTLATETEVDKNGVSHGLSKVFLKDGSKRAEGHNVHGKMDGKWTWWRPDGTIWSVGNFVLNSREGEWLRYKKDGTLEVTKIFKDDKEISSIKA